MAEVVLVEDDCDLRRSLSDCLVMMGHSAYGVGSAVELYQAMATRKFDVAVVDINLPHYDGFSVVQYLSETSDLGIIVASARSALEDRVRGYRSGVDIYMTKPIDPEELAAAIDGLGAKKNGRSAQAEPVWACSVATMSLTAPNGCRIGLTRREMLFVVRFVGDARGSVSREAVLDALGETDPEKGRRKLDTLVSRLRTKVRDRAGLPLPIDTVQGSGFAAACRFVSVDQNAASAR